MEIKLTSNDYLKDRAFIIKPLIEKKQLLVILEIGKNLMDLSGNEVNDVWYGYPELIGQTGKFIQVGGMYSTMFRLTNPVLIKVGGSERMQSDFYFSHITLGVVEMELSIKDEELHEIDKKRIDFSEKSTRGFNNSPLGCSEVKIFKDLDKSEEFVGVYEQVRRDAEARGDKRSFSDYVKETGEVRDSNITDEELGKVFDTLTIFKGKHNEDGSYTDYTDLSEEEKKQWDEKMHNPKEGQIRILSTGVDSVKQKFNNGQWKDFAYNFEGHDYYKGDLRYFFKKQDYFKKELPVFRFPFKSDDIWSKDYPSSELRDQALDKFKKGEQKS